MKERFYRVLNIKFSESQQVFDLLTVQFFIGLANAFVNIVAFTLFIYIFPINTLPIVYLAIAALLIILNLVYEKLEHSVSPLQLLKYIIAFSALILLILWAGLLYGNKNNFVFILLIWSVLMYMLTSYAFWGLVSILFNVRESRRIFSIVGSGDIPAKLIGYAAVPLLIPVLGLYNLIWFAVISLIIGFFLFRKYVNKKHWDTVRKKSHGHVHASLANLRESIREEKKDIVNFFFKSRLIFSISLLSILSYNVFVLIDYTFISQVKLKFVNMAELATYIAVFFALGRFIALIFKLIFTSRVIEKLGIISSLFITPVAMFSFCLVFIFFGNNPSYNILIFGLMAILTEVLRSSIQEPVFFVLFQPLSEQLRLKGHMISKGYMYPPSLIIVGLSLFFLHKTGTDVTILLTVKVVLFNLLIWAAIIFLIRKAYLVTIHASIRKGIFSSDDIHIYDQRSIDILLGKTQTGRKNEVIYALNLLEKANYTNINKLLEEQLHSAEPDIQNYALDQLEKSESIKVPVLKELLQTQMEPEFEQKVVALLCKLDPEYLEEAANGFADKREDLQKIIIIHLMNQREFKHLYKAGSALTNLINSGRPGDKALALDIISEVKHVQFESAIRNMINDPETAVRRKAVTAACKLKMKALLPVIMELLDKPSDKYLVLKGLMLYGDELFSHITDLGEHAVEKYLPDLIKIAGTIKGPCSTEFLLQYIDKTDGKTDKLIHALWAKEYIVESSAESQRLQVILESTLRDGLAKKMDFAQMPQFTDRELVSRSITNEIKYDLISALKICSILYKKKEINRVLELIETDKNDKIYNAMEMLELVLPKKISKDLNLLFDFILDPGHIQTPLLPAAPSAFFQKIVFNDVLAYNPWTKAVCVYCSWKSKDKDFIKSLGTKNFTGEHYIMNETREYVISAPNQ